MFFESQHSAISDVCILHSPTKTEGFPTHLHQAFEFYAVKEGKVLVKIENKSYTLTKDQAVLVFPYQRHSYEVLESAMHVACLFSLDFAPEFYRNKQNLQPKDNSFYLSPKIIFPEEDYLLKKAFIYTVLSEFERGAKYEESEINGKNALLCKILIFLSQNFDSDCSLKAVSKYLDYDYAYISKFFKRETKTSIHSYVNSLRIGKAKSMLLSEDLPIYIIAEKCGFSCLRSFNREFIKQVGVSPTRFKKEQSVKQQ